MEPQFPRVAIGLYHFRLARHVVVAAVLHVALAHEWLKIRPKLDAVRGVFVDHLHLPTQALELQHRVHHLQAIAENHPVLPRALVLVGVELVGHV